MVVPGAPLNSTLQLSTLSSNNGLPDTLPAAMLTVTLPLTVAPLAGVVIVAVSGVAPDGRTGDVASLKRVIFGETVWLPAESVATALTSYAAGGSGPVIHRMVPLQVVPEHGIVPKTAPSPQSSMCCRPLSSVAIAAMSMLLPVHAVSEGFNMLTVGFVSAEGGVAASLNFRTKTSSDADGGLLYAPGVVEMKSAPAPPVT